jgi:hypothetical protein
MQHQQMHRRRTRSKRAGRIGLRTLPWRARGDVGGELRRRLRTDGDELRAFQVCAAGTHESRSPPFRAPFLTRENLFDRTGR